MTSTIQSAQPGPTDQERRATRRVLFSSYLGSAIEFYDFLIYGTAAALVLGPLFFTGLPPVVATIASFSTLAVGYVARPVGGVIFGHFGDRIGRKRMLVLTMLLMGGSSTLIGLLPTTETIGVAAPLLLILLRLIQGVSVGGEWGGATLMAMEHSTGRRRGFAAAIANAGGPTGAMLAAAIMGLASLMPDEQFMNWGWRIPFLISAVLVGISLWVRMRVQESPMFVKAQAQAREQQAEKKRSAPPILAVLRHPLPVILACVSGIGALGFQSMIASFGLNLAVDSGAVRSTALFAGAVGSLLNAITVPTFGALSDKIGRRPVLLGGMIAGIVLTWPLLEMFKTGSPLALFGAYLIGYGLVVGSCLGTLGAFVSEQFSTTSRYTGASLGYQLASTIGAGFAPLVATSVLSQVGSDQLGFVALVFISAFALSTVAVLCTRESFRKDMEG